LSYTNIIYLLVVILLFSTSSPPEHPQLPVLYASTLFLVKMVGFRELVRFFFREYRIKQPPHYFAAEQRVSIIAVLSLAIDVYLLDCQYYFARLPLTGKIPTFISLCGVILYFFYMSIIWGEAAKSYAHVFGRTYRRLAFIANNLKTNVPIILPWLCISMLSDILQILHIPALSRFLGTAWGEGVVLLTFFVFLAVFFPLIITRLWGCRPLPLGEARSRIEEFCAGQKLKYADILTWPLFEGQVLTAGVIGIAGRFRYLLVTPALLRAMAPVEIEAVMAHEIGHVKKHHMQLYLFLFIGFGIFAQLSSYPVLYGLLNSNLFYKIANLANKEPGSALAFASTIPMLVLMILYFRFVFGFFMRNFERQADLHVFEAMGDSRPLINVLEKIGFLSGNIRDLPSWHHFGIGQRVDYLKLCQNQPACIHKHNSKVRSALALYAVLLVLAGFLLWKIPANILEGAPREKFVEAVLNQKIQEDPQNFIWFQLLGDLQQARKLNRQAARAYEKALTLAPDNAEVMNNLAWVLLTAEDDKVRDPDRALVLAHEAVRIKPKGYIFDTLALAYWENGFTESAIRAEKEAVARDPANRDYYEKQIRTFSHEESAGGVPD
jgi:Zn-dependent protease with chaperone function